MKHLNRPNPDLTKTEIPPHFLSGVYIARCSLDYKGSCSSPEGQVSDFNMWSRFLTEQDMKDFTTCGKMLKGDLINWDQSQWELINMTSRNADDSEICIPPRPGHVLYPEKRNYTSLIELCAKFKGKPSVVKDNETQLELTARAAQYKECQVRVLIQPT